LPSPEEKDEKVGEEKDGVYIPERNIQGKANKREQSPPEADA